MALQKSVVDEAEHPRFPGFKRADYGMRRGFGMSARMPVLGGVATPHLSTRHTNAKVYPRITLSDALRALGAGDLDVADRVTVSAINLHHSYLP
jgi:hypothetical protein